MVKDGRENDHLAKVKAVDFSQKMLDEAKAACAAAIEKENAIPQHFDTLRAPEGQKSIAPLQTLLFGIFLMQQKLDPHEALTQFWT